MPSRSSSNCKAQWGKLQRLSDSVDIMLISIQILLHVKEQSPVPHIVHLQKQARRNLENIVCIVIISRYFYYLLLFLAISSLLYASNIFFCKISNCGDQVGLVGFIYFVTLQNVCHFNRMVYSKT